MIYRVDDVMTKEENDELATVALSLSQQYTGTTAIKKWLSGKDSPQNSWCVDDISYPDIVRTLSDRLCDSVSQICDMNPKLEPIEFWYNVYDNTQYQEPHIHSPAIFSLVYFNKMPRGSAPFLIDGEEMNVNEGSAIIFPSFVKHGVERGTNSEPRITWAMNLQ